MKSTKFEPDKSKKLKRNMDITPGLTHNSIIIEFGYFDDRISRKLKNIIKDVAMWSRVALRVPMA